MRIANRAIAPGEPPYVIAEIGVNHDGSADRALELVEAAAAAGADAIKLQLFEAERLLSSAARLAAYQRDAGASDPVEMLRALELSADEMLPIVEKARVSGLHAIVTVFSVELIADAERLAVDAYKTASPDIINRPLIEALIATQRPLLLSTGACSLHEMDNARLWVGKHPHIFMQCVSAYPAPEDCAALGARLAMARLDPQAVGYSDHTTAIDTGALAVASGALVLEKHLTYDRSAAGPDHAASLDPEQFDQYVQLARRASRMLGRAEKRVLDIELDVRDVARQSITAARDLPAGHVLTREDVTIKRPGGGLAPFRMAEAVGRRLRHKVEANALVHEDDFE